MIHKVKFTRNRCLLQKRWKVRVRAYIDPEIILIKAICVQNYFHVLFRSIIAKQ